MICKACVKAGERNTLALDPTRPDLASARRKQAERHHALCRGDTWCDCQHFTGKSINREGN